MTRIGIVVENRMAKMWVVEMNPEREFARVAKVGYDTERQAVKKAVFHFYLDGTDATCHFSGASYYDTMETAMVAEDPAWEKAWNKAKAGW